MAKNNLIPAAQHYKLFESNDIAKFGIMLITGKALPPIAYKALMYLIWKWTCVSGTDGNSKNAFQPAAQSYDITLPITELGWALGYCRDKNRNFARDMRNICNAVQNIMATPLTVYDSKENKALTFVWLCLVEYDFIKQSIYGYQIEIPEPVNDIGSGHSISVFLPVLQDAQVQLFRGRPCGASDRGSGLSVP